MTEISNILLESAKDTFGTVDKTGRRSHCILSRKHDKCWSNSECHRARKEFRKSKRLYKLMGLIYLRQDCDIVKKITKI